jgi:CheY-like chemotaxis protein
MAVNRLRVLCVDDNRDIADSEAMLLNLLGYDSLACYDGPQALVEAHRFSPDVFLLDLNMPGMDGCEIARELRARYHVHPPLLVAITAKSGTEDYRRTSDAGFDAHLVKPVAPNRLVEMLSALKPS